MSAVRCALILVCVLAGASCQQLLEAPSRDELYEPLDLSEAIAVSVIDLTEAPEIEPGNAELVLWALADWSSALNGRLRFYRVPAEEDALIRVRFVPPYIDQYGEMFAITVDGRRGAIVYVRPDTEALGPAIARRARHDPLFRESIVYQTCLHELGHALGLGHTRTYADIMYSMAFGRDIEEYLLRYRRRLREPGDMETQSALSRGDRARIRALYAAKTLSGP